MKTNIECEGCKERDSVIQAALYYCGQVIRMCDHRFSTITKDLQAASSEALSELIRLRARHELAKEIHKAIKSEIEKWEIVYHGNEH